MPYDIIVLEKLSIKRKKEQGKRFNSILNGWSYYQLEQFIEYKATKKGKRVEYVDARYMVILLVLIVTNPLSNVKHVVFNSMLTLTLLVISKTILTLLLASLRVAGCNQSPIRNRL